MQKGKEGWTSSSPRQPGAGGSVGLGVCGYRALGHPVRCGVCRTGNIKR